MSDRPARVFRVRWIVLGMWVLRGAAMALRVATFNVENGVGPPGSAEFKAAQETLRRLAPDVIALQEVSAQNPNPNSAAHFADLKALLAELGFQTSRSFLATAGDGWQAQAFDSGDFGSTAQCLAIASRHPITKTVQIGRGIAGRKEQTRYPLFVQIDLPGTTEDPAFVNVHLKQGDTMADEFRRGVEALRVVHFLQSQGKSGAAHPIVVLGDMNEEINEPQTPSFDTAGLAGGARFADGSSLPASYVLGSGIPPILTYARFPGSGFSESGMGIVPALQTDGTSDRTYNFAGDSRLDYILTGDHTRRAGTVRAEVYHSGREPVGDGLPKDPGLPVVGLSGTASDHLPVFADIMLEAGPELTLGLPVEPIPVNFTSATPGPSGVVRIPMARNEPLTVTIAPFRRAPLRPIAPVIIEAGLTSAEFPIEVAGSPFTHDRRITLVASASGYRDGVGILPTRGTGVVGQVVISQYTEAPSGTSPKAIEVMNVSSGDIDFSAEPMRVIAYDNGSAASQTEARVESGRLPRGAVMVIGDSATGGYLIGQGLLRGTAAVAGSQSGTVFTDDGEPDGRVVFVKDAFTFNGNDALELIVNSRRCDVFGQPGNAVATAWTTPGDPTISTRNQNLSRRRSAIRPSAGWTSPGEFFEAVTSGPLAGIGVAPVIDDPYAAWAAARGFAGGAAEPAADPDQNGVPNGIEFVFGAAPSPPFVALQSGRLTWTMSLTVRNHLGNIRWGVDEADGTMSWQTVAESLPPVVPATGEFSPLRLERPATPEPQRYVRLFATRP